jgi:GTPase Era involved in 16S rRNA processing
MKRFLLPATDKRTATLHLFCVGAIHKPGGTYITVLRRAKEKFCSDVQSRSVASSSNATMLSTVQLSAVAPTLEKKGKHSLSKEYNGWSKIYLIYTLTKITHYFHKVSYLQHMRTVQDVVEHVQVVPTRAKVGIPLTHQPMDSLHKKVPELLLESPHHYTRDVSV